MCSTLYLPLKHLILICTLLLNCQSRQEWHSMPMRVYCIVMFCIVMTNIAYISIDWNFSHFVRCTTGVTMATETLPEAEYLFSLVEKNDHQELRKAILQEDGTLKEGVENLTYANQWRHKEPLLVGNMQIIIHIHINTHRNTNTHTHTHTHTWSLVSGPWSWYTLPCRSLVSR